MLSGINRKCEKCTQSCKQWQQVKVIICPFFKKDISQAQQNAKEALELEIIKD
jgi:hypothetical protein